MRAIVQDSYGSAGVLELRDIAKPAFGETQVRVRVRAASFNAGDWYMMTGLPYLLRIGFGVRAPRETVPGADVAGVVESVGGKVTRFRPGDSVFGACRGAFAEYACAEEKNLSAKPGNVTFEQAAAVPVAGLTALQALRDQGRVQAGQRVLITGAAGGVGSFAVQLAKSFGAEVTGVCRAASADLVLSMGADQVMDYGRNDFATSGRRFDLMLDIRATWPLSACRRLLEPGGTYVLVGAPRGGRWLGPLIPTLRVIASKPVARCRLRFFVANVNREDLSLLAELMTSGTLGPVVDRTFPLSQLPQAIRHWETGRVRGKVVVTVSKASTA